MATQQLMRAPLCPSTTRCLYPSPTPRLLPACKSRELNARAAAAPSATVWAEEDLVAEPYSGDWQHHQTTTRDWDEGFAKYRQATEGLEALQSLQAELMSSVQNIDSLLTSPPEPPRYHKVPESAEARSARRRQEREARKAAQALTEVSPQQDLATEGNAKQLENQLAELAAMNTELAALVQEENPLQSAVATQPELHRRVSSAQSQLTTQQSPVVVSGLPAQALHEVEDSQASVQLAVPTTLPQSLQVSQVQQQAAISQYQSQVETQNTASSAKQRHSARASRSRGGQTINTPAQAAVKGSQRSSSGATSTSAQFLNLATQTSVLMGDQQRELAYVVRDFLWLERVQKQLKSILKRMPTPAECAKALNMDTQLYEERVQAGKQAKNLMLKSNYRLVTSVAIKYQNRGMTLQDLVAEGMQGLLRGVEKYDVDKGFRFSTYAHWWIRQAITRALQMQARTVRLPSHIHDQLMKLLAVRTRLSKEFSRQATHEEMSVASGIPVDKIPGLLAAAVQASSLEVPAGGEEDGGSEMKDMIADERSTPDEHFNEEMMEQNLEELLKQLNPREAQILRMRLGLNGMPTMTLDDIGNHFKVTRERIRQIEVKTFSKLQQLRNASSNIMVELQGAQLDETSGLSGRASRGTKKT